MVHRASIQVASKIHGKNFNFEDSFILGCKVVVNEAFCVSFICWSV